MKYILIILTLFLIGCDDEYGSSENIDHRAKSAYITVVNTFKTPTDANLKIKVLKNGWPNNYLSLCFDKKEIIFDQTIWEFYRLYGPNQDLYGVQIILMAQRILSCFYGVLPHQHMLLNMSHNQLSLRYQSNQSLWLNDLILLSNLFAGTEHEI